jgi:hypothetical protein
MSVFPVNQPTVAAVVEEVAGSRITVGEDKRGGSWNVCGDDRQPVRHHRSDSC